jgi:TolB-like protein/tetratricopeptide (TPR) repeat protein
MKRLGQITSIPLETHTDQLMLLNETVGDSAGSSDNLIPRIYRKWKGALPDLENAPLFKVIGRKKEQEDGTGRTYRFSEAEKDLWANLFEYKGSEEHVRLRFSVDKLGAGLDDAVILYGDARDQDAWERFIASLKAKPDDKSVPESIIPTHEVPSPALPAMKKGNAGKLFHQRSAVLVAILAVVVGITSFALWQAYGRTNNRASIEKMAFPLPDKPSIAVLPFTSMSDDPKQEYFSDGITEDIITNLSKLPSLFVVSRNSTFLYKGKGVRIEEVARDLGVRHVLEGSVRRSGDRVRITAQLIDGKTGQHVWADKYDRELKDIFSVQDEVTRKVVSELALALTTTESERLFRKHTANFEAYDMYLRARVETQVLKKQNAFKAMEMSQRVIDLDPRFAGGYQNLSHLLSRGIRLGWSGSPREDLEKAHELAQKAISVDDKFPRSYAALASVYLMQGKHDDALATANIAATIVPGDSETMLWLGYYLQWVGRGDEAVAAVKKSVELNPMYLSGRNPTYLDFMGQVCFTAGLYEESISNMKKVIERFGSTSSRDPFLIASYSMLGRMEEAKEAAQQWLKADPTFSLSSYKYGHLYKRPEDNARLHEALRKAGLK